MSYSVEFYAADWRTAQSRLSHEHLPETVRDGLLVALENYPHAGPVYVKADGHLRTEPTDRYGSSWGTYKIMPIDLLPSVIPEINAG